MKRLSAYIAAVFCLIAAQAALAQVEIPLPEAHWAYEDMAALAEKGLVPGYEAFDFRGRRTFTREEIAEAIVAALDHYTNTAGAFKPDEVSLLSKLMEEFEAELDKLGETRTLAPPGIEPQVPVNHWAYKTFADFAGRGMLPDYGEESFRGGRIFTRKEMAALAGILIDIKNRTPETFSEKDLQAMAYLEEEFQKEIKALQTEPGFQPVRTPAQAVSAPRFVTTGSSNLYVGVMKGNKSSVTNRITLEPKGVFAQGYFSGNVDNTDRTGMDIDFGRSYTFELSRKMVGFHSHAAEPGRDSYLLAGDVNNLDFSQGLSVGATNVKGFFLSLAGAAASRVNLAWGEDDSDREFLAARYQRESAGNWEWGIAAVNESSESIEKLKSIGFDVARRTASKKLAVEVTSVESAGFGAFVRYNHILNKVLEAEFECRKYRDFVPGHNNPPMYLGRSGGNGENEKSVYGRVEWRPGSRLAFSLSRDHVYTPENGRKTNVFFGQEYRASQAFRIGWGWEKEQGAGISETERSVKMSYSGFSRSTVSASWKRGVLRGGPSSTTRLDFTRSFADDSLKLILSFTRRRTWTQRTHSYRTRLSKRIRSSATVTMSYDYSENTQRRFDLNLTWNF